MANFIHIGVGRGHPSKFCRGTNNQVQPLMGQSTNRECTNSTCMDIIVCVGGKDACTLNISDAVTILRACYCYIVLIT